MYGSQYALAHGIRQTRLTLARWRTHPRSVLTEWLAGSALAALALLVAVAAIATISHSYDFIAATRPPLGVGHFRDVVHILASNSLVLALHAMACVAGFIAGSSLPLQASRQRNPLLRTIHEHGGRVAIAAVIGATAFSLGVQALVLGRDVESVASAVGASPLVLLLGLLPHAVPELMALFLPLAAWIIASRRGEWDSLLAATAVTVVIAVPTLVATALWEVYVAPHVLHALISYP